MKAASLLMLCGFVCLAVGCSSWTVSHDFDNEANFEAFKSYAWIAQPKNAVGSAQAAQERNSLLDKRIKNEVNTQLHAKGFAENPDAPDVLLAYYTGVDDKVDVTSYGYSYPGHYGGWGHYGYGYGGGGVDVYQYKQGTLIVDMIDSSSKQLVWRGTVTGVLESNPTPEKIEKNLASALGKMFSQYPPKQ